MGLYLAALRALNEVRGSFDQPDLAAAQLSPLMGQLLQDHGAASEHYYRQLPLLEQAETIRGHFDATLSLLATLGDSDIPPDQVTSRTDHWLHHHQQHKTITAQIPVLIKQHQQRQQEEEQLKKLQQALTALPESWRQGIQDEASWDSSLGTAGQEQRHQQQQVETLREQIQQTRRTRDQVQATLDQRPVKIISSGRMPAS